MKNVRQANKSDSIEALFRSWDLDFDSAKQKVNEIFSQGLVRKDSSYHYELFAALALKLQPQSMLEIGTFHGNFTEFLARLSPNSKIVTLELPADLTSTSQKSQHSLMKQHYGVEVPKVATERLKHYDNVIQVWSDSTFLIDYKDKFDLAWIDGDRSFPVIAFDILNSLRLLNEGGIVCVDDVRLSNSRLFPFGVNIGKLSANEPITTLSYLESIDLINLSLLPKRIQDFEFSSSKVNPKYIGIIQRTGQRDLL